LDPLEPTLKKVAFRLAVQRWLYYLTMALISACSAACVWLVLTRLFPALGDPVIGAAVLVFGGMIGATVLAVVRRPRLVEAALAADERLGLKERLTSSLQLDGVDHEMVRALHDDARRQIARINIGRDFPFVAPQALRWLSVPILIYGVGFLMLPEFDLLNYNERQAMAREQERRAMEAVEEVEEAVKPLREMAAAKVDSEVGKIVGSVDDLMDEFAKGEINEKQMLARLVNKAEEAAQRAKALEESRPSPKLSDNPREYGEGAEAADALNKGDFKKAAEELAKMKAKMEQGGMSEEERKQLSQDLKKLSDALSEQDDMMSQEMAKALSEAAAQMEQGNMEGAGQAMADAQMTAQEMESVMTQLAEMQKAQQCLGGACEGAGQSMGMGQGFGQLAQGSQGIGGNWQQGMGGQSQGGMGQRGQGRGGQIGELPETATNTSPSVLPGEMTDGPMLATTNELAPPDEEGAESNVEFVQGSIEQVQQDAERALAQEEIPPGAKEFVRQYFGTMEPGQEGQESRQ